MGDAEVGQGGEKAAGAHPPSTQTGHRELLLVVITILLTLAAGYKKLQEHTASHGPAPPPTFPHKAPGPPARAPGTRASGPSIRRPMIVCYQSTLPSNPHTPGYMTASFVFVSLYAAANNIRFNYYVAPREDPPEPANGHRLPGCGPKEFCRHGNEFCHRRTVVASDGVCLLSPVWGKVKAVLAALNDPDPPAYVLQLDTDATIRFESFTTHVSEWLSKSLERTNTNFEDTALIAAQEQPTWWCNTELKSKNHTKPWNINYFWCINTGMFLVNNNEHGHAAAQAWWESALDEYSEDPLQHQFREQWPWEQSRLEYLINDPARPANKLMTVLPDPHQLHLRDWSVWEKEPGGCFGAVPRWRCFVSHYCTDHGMKHYWGNRTMHLALTLLHACNSGEDTVEVTHGQGDHDAVSPGYPWTLKFPLDWCTNVHRDIDVPAPMSDPDFYNKRHVEWQTYEPYHAALYAAAKALESMHVQRLP